MKNPIATTDEMYVIITSEYAINRNGLIVKSGTINSIINEARYLIAGFKANNE
ncbi:unnamed protein product [marine sediment metagenome]|uniref:Uncharacterized protein n=1 Tax=marine sediment metagenome TaxID=412755 RepID=X0SS37_9ZZZZ